MADTIKPLSSAPYLLTKIQEKSMTPEQLSVHQRRICVRFLLQEKKHTQVQIATILRISQQTVSSLKRKIQNQNSWLLDEMDERRVGVDILEMAEAAATSLFRKGKERDAWTVLRESVEVMQTLGYLIKRPTEVTLNGNITVQEILKLATDHSEDEKSIFSYNGRGSAQGNKISS